MVSGPWETKAAEAESRKRYAGLTTENTKSTEGTETKRKPTGKWNRGDAKTRRKRDSGQRRGRLKTEVVEFAEDTVTIESRHVDD